MCNFTTNTTAVTIARIQSPTSPESSFSLNTSHQHMKVIHFSGRPQGSWMLWKTKFQIDSYHTMSSNKNFTKNLDKIVSYQTGHTFHVTISETQYASGNYFITLNCKCAILVVLYNKANETATLL